MKGRGRNRFSFLWGTACFFLLIACVIQIAVLTYDGIIERTKNNLVIGTLLLAVIVTLSLICTVIDTLRRRKAEKPLERILDGTEEMARGNFSVRFTPDHPYGKYTNYDVIMENLNALAAELEKTEVLKSDFISNVSHEMKTPLTVVQSYASLLQADELEDETRKKYARTLETAAKRLSDLVTNILKLNKLENQEIRAEYSSFDLTECLANCIVGYEEKLEEKGVELDCDLDDVRAYSASGLLELVWNNLLSNAVKFTDAGGRVAVKLKKSGKDAVVSVSDTGCGISPETGARIFEKFYQGDTSHSGEGNGLGLALVKKVIDILGGEVSVSSERGKGSTFTVLLKGVCDER